MERIVFFLIGNLLSKQVQRSYSPPDKTWTNCLICTRNNPLMSEEMRTRGMLWRRLDSVLKSRGAIKRKRFCIHSLDKLWKRLRAKACRCRVRLHHLIKLAVLSLTKVRTRYSHIKCQNPKCQLRQLSVEEAKTLQFLKHGKIQSNSEVIDPSTVIQE